MAQRENPSAAGSSAQGPKVRSAGAFDVRSIIGGLLGVYGLILVVTGLWFTEAADKAKVNGTNLNLWAGLGLLAFAALMIGWVVLRPLTVPVEDDAVL